MSDFDDITASGSLFKLEKFRQNPPGVDQSGFYRVFARARANRRAKVTRAQMATDYETGETETDESPSLSLVAGTVYWRATESTAWSGAKNRMAAFASIMKH